VITSLLRTKLYKPRPARALVQRPLLVQLLEQGADRDLAIVVAPAGFGKTTLVATWAAQTALPVAWLALDEHDNDPARFLTYVVAAIQTLYAEAFPETSAILRGGNMPELAVLTALLINEIDDLPARFTLVLDDYHNIRAQAVHELLDEVLRHPPLQMHLLIASRADPPLALARLRANGRINELRIAQLRFSREETIDFLTGVTGAVPSARAVEVLMQRAEGWIAGIQLAVLSLGTVPDHDAMLRTLERGNDRYVMDYLFEQVLQRQSTEVQEFLLKISILERISAPLARAVVADEDAQLPITLGEIERAGLFLTALDSTGEWFAFHALFRELLRHHLRMWYAPDAVVELHRRAGKWLAQNNLIEEALHHTLAAGDVDGAAQLIIDHFVTWLGREDWRAIDRWLALMPGLAYETHPWLLVVKAHVLHIQSDWNAVNRLLDMVEAWLAAGEDKVGPDERLLLQGYLDMLWAIRWSVAGEAKEAIAVARRALQSLPPEHFYVRGAIQTALILAMHATGDAAGAMALLQDELVHLPRSEAGANYRVRAVFNLLSLQLADGNLVAADQIAQRLLREATEQDARVTQLWAHLALGISAYEANDLPRAAEHFALGVELRRAGHVRGGHECLIWLAFTYQAMGRAQDAQNVVALLADYHRQLGNPQLVAEGIALQVHLAARNGAVPTGIERLVVSPAGPAIWFGWTEIPAIARIYALLVEPSPAALDQALRLVDDLLAIATAYHKPARRAQLLAIKARVHQQRAEREAACAALAAAVTLGEPRGLIRSIADAGPQLRPVLIALEQTTPSPYLARLQAALQPAAGEAANNGAATVQRPSDPPVRLTRREREVLTLLGAYLTDREIADQLVISPLTVRTHIEHIGEKLGVTGRRAIVARALETGMLK
jgi:LuxR family maltose regulon positive regulatory protein